MEDIIVGMFDTLLLEKPIVCPKCNTTINDTQTKELNNIMEYYKTGDYLKEFLDKIYEEEIYCEKCKDFLKEKVFVAIKNHILVGIKDTYEEAQECSNNIIKLLPDLLKKNYEEKVKLSRNLNLLVNNIYHLKEYYENLTKPNNKKFMIFLEIFSEKYKYNNILQSLEKLLKEGEELRRETTDLF